MNSVLVGMFDTQAAATEARSRLVTAGFSGSAVSMTGSDSTPATTISDGAGASPVREGGIGHFFRSLFGGGEDETYHEAFRRGSWAVSVTATSEAELDRAETILNDSGAVDIDEKAVQWKAEGWSGGSLGASVASAATSLKDGATRALHGVEDELKDGRRSVQRGGVRIFGRDDTAGVTGTGSRSDAESANRDPLSGEPGSHPVGTAVGASAGGIAAGAAVGSVAGPVGTVIGAAVGAVAGGLAGKGVAEKVDPTVPPRS